MQHVSLILFGVGGVGGELVRQIVAARQFHAEQYDLTLDILAACDSQGVVTATDNGIDDAALLSLVELKDNGGRVADHALGEAYDGDLDAIVEQIEEPGAIIVDLTATEATIPALLAAREQQHKLVLANKKPLTVSQEVYNRLTRAGLTETGRMTPHFSVATRWEATVGAGLPVIATENRLVASGDEITRVAGTFSGTLGYVMSGLQAGRPLSEIVREAHQLGYTEPDPRDDLGGVDVARKALILARGLGWKMDLSDVEITGLYPPEMDDLSVPEFLAALPELDAEMDATIRNAESQGGVLRYAATVEGERCAVQPTVVSAESPLGRLSGTDNLVEFHSRWYSPNPLVIQGKGAGVEATAAGVLSDIVELAYIKCVNRTA